MSFKIFYTGKTKRDNWECFSWSVHLGDQTFEYYTGLGHSTKGQTHFGLKPKSIQGKTTIREGSRDQVIFVHVPRLKDVLYSLVLDASSAIMPFEDFCSDYGYSPDSRKALETYLKCQETVVKLSKVMKSKDYLNRIQSWEL